MSWKDPFITITFPTKVIFIISSWLLFIIHLAVLLSDLYHFLVTHRGDLMSFDLSVSLLFTHVTSFYFALLASIYTIQAQDYILMYLALTSFALNFSLFISRFFMDYFTIEYREEKYE